MKKILFLKAAAFCCAIATLSMLTSCSDNDDNPIRYSANITVNPKAIYDELNLSAKLPLFFADQRITVVDSVLIYDQDGLLVKKLGAESSTNLDPMTIEAKGLADGTYTLVAWQTIITHVNGYDESAWKVTGEDQLSTVSVMATLNPLFYVYALGYDSATLTVNGGSADVSLTPKAMGSTCRLTVDNFTDESGYELVLLFTRDDQLKPGIRLNPALDETDRYIENTDPGTYNCVGYVTNEWADFTFFTLSHGDDLYLELLGENVESVDYIHSMELVQLGVGENVTYYMDYKSLEWQPPFFGDSEVVAKWKNDREEGLLVADPLLDWGCSIADIEKHIQAKQWWFPGNQGLEYWEEGFDSWHQWYWVASKLTEQYLFETEDGQNLRYVQCYNWSNNLPYEAAKTWLLKLGFTYQDEREVPFDDGLYDFYISSDGKSAAYSQPFDERWLVVFTPYGN